VAVREHGGYDHHDAPAETSTGTLLARYLGRHLERLEAEQARALAGHPEGVHQVRVAARRMRSVLATYRSVLPPEAEGLRAELSWLGGSLGVARDTEVMGARLRALVDDQPAELVVGPVRRRLDDEVGARSATGLAETAAALADERYTRLLDRLAALRDAVGSREAADRPARRQVPRLLQGDLDRVRKRHRRVLAAQEPGERDAAMHEMRKAAKRLRYAAESAQPVFGSRAEQLARTAEALQEALGEHQDSVVARGVLQQVAAEALQDGESGFTYGRLHALEEARATEIERGLPDLVARLPSGRIRRWLSG
jgi:CHAD domain-containing protein